MSATARYQLVQIFPKRLSSESFSEMIANISGTKYDNDKLKTLFLTAISPTLDEKNDELLYTSI